MISFNNSLISPNERYSITYCLPEKSVRKIIYCLVKHAVSELNIGTIDLPLKTRKRFFSSFFFCVPPKTP